jgi:predicted dehydrogenase
MHMVRWAIVGTGRMAVTMAQEIDTLRSDGAQVVAVCSRSSHKAAEFARRFAIPKHYARPEDLYSDPDVDAIYIATPHSQHFTAMLAAIAAGKAVLCEKPFTLNAKEAQMVIAAARHKQVFVMEAMWTRFLPAVAAVREAIAARRIGEVQLIIGGGAFIPAPDPEHYLLSPALGGGVLLDAGVYLLSLCSMLQGEPKRIQVTARLGASGVDEQDAMLLEYGTGAAALLYVSLHARRSPDLEILGTSGRISIDAPIFKPTRVRIWDHQGVQSHHDYPIVGSGYGYQIRAVNDALRAGLTESALMPLPETLSIMRSMDAIRSLAGLSYPTELQ